jgi:quercetin dioxygenase-like cupin family protein
MMRIIRTSVDHLPSEVRGATFTGLVHAVPILPATDGVMINAVTFTPGARTYWHSHEHGQILSVVLGSGWVCAEGQTPQRLGPGDVVWAAPGEVHWHGAATDSLLAHQAVSLGSTRWHDPVAEADYRKCEAAS